MSESLNQHELNEFAILISRSLDGSITRDEVKRMEGILESSAQMRTYYRQYVSIYCDVNSLLKGTQLDSSDMNSLQEVDFWKAMAEYENSAPTIEIPEEKPQRELIQKVVYPPREKRRLSKFSIFTFVNVAAVILFFVVLNYIPFNGGVEVATLTDSINAKWADVAAPIGKGTRIVAGKQPLLLREGYAELSFDTNARVVIEAPAEFQILAEDRIGLNYGKIYSMVPEEAIGFSVYTQNAKIIDLGTEFGVEVDSRGNTQLHVLKGNTMLIADDQSGKSSTEVGKGEAKKVSSVSKDVSGIPCDLDMFTRHIDSEVGIVWKGQNRINLADIVGGGNGFGTGTIDMGIEPMTGKPSREFTGLQESTNGYHPVPSSYYIDGIFVPNGQTRQVVSSQGHLFQECPGFKWILL